MQVIGFNFTKISSSINPNYKGEFNVNTNIEFGEMTKEESEIVKEDIVKITFEFSVSYDHPKNKDEKKGQVSFEGNLLISSSKEDAKELLTSWKKKEIPAKLKMPLFNLILKKCSLKAVYLEDEIGLPPHIPLPQLAPSSEKK